MSVCALVPIKDVTRAKTRLRAVLSKHDTAFLAEQMANLTIDTLTRSTSVGRIVLLGSSRGVASTAEEFGCEFASENPSQDLSANLHAAASSLGLHANDTLAIFPADIPLITATDVDDLIERHEQGLTLCPAARDGGTNALLLTPPTAIEFQFGHDSARRHAEAARAAGLPVRIIDSPVFSRDIDVPEDLDWLSRARHAGPLLDALRRQGILPRISDPQTALSA